MIIIKIWKKCNKNIGLQNKNVFAARIKKLIQQWDKYLIIEENYIEKYINYYIHFKETVLKS